MTMIQQLKVTPCQFVRTLIKMVAILTLALPMALSGSLDQVKAQELTPQSVKARSERSYTPLTISKQDKHVTFQVEVADNDNTRALGLMFRTKMPENEGMIFDFGESRPVYMWMQNTYVSLDMLFINEQGQVHHIVESTTPLSRSLIGSGGPVRYVLEVKAGTVKRHQLKKGDQVQHQLFTSN
jgi:uncharacterized membrane protein (UPF0127 family)